MGGISLYRNILCLTAMVVALFMGTALAAPRAMNVDDVVIAGIAPGSDLSYVRSIYGEPDGEKTIRIGNYNHPAYTQMYNSIASQKESAYGNIPQAGFFLLRELQE